MVFMVIINDYAYAVLVFCCCGQKKRVYIFIILVCLLHKFKYRGGNKVSMDIICKRIGSGSVWLTSYIHTNMPKINTLRNVWVERPKRIRIDVKNISFHKCRHCDKWYFFDVTSPYHMQALRDLEDLE